MRALQSLHEGFGRNFGAALSGLLRTIVEVKLTSVDQLTYSEFVFSLENPTCFNLLRAEPLEGNLILDINPSILYPIIDRLLGGGKDAGPLSRRPLTEIELRLVSPDHVAVSRRAAARLGERARRWTFGRARREQPAARADRAAERSRGADRLRADAADVRGMMNLCIPFNCIERIGSKLSANNWLTYSRRGATPESIQHIGRSLRGALVELVVELAESKITTGDLSACASATSSPPRRTSASRWTCACRA